MSSRQNKKRKGRNHINNRERTVTTFTEDPNTSFLVPLSSEDPPNILTSSPFSMPYQSYINPQQQPFFQPVLPPGKSDLEILENLKTIIKEGQHEFYRAVPQPAALASLYIGHVPQGLPHPEQLQQDYHSSPRFSHDTDTAPTSNTVEPSLSGTDSSPSKLAADPPDASSPPDVDDTAPGNTNTDATGEYGTRQPLDSPSPNKASPFDAPIKNEEPAQLAAENTWERRPSDDRQAHNDNSPQNRASAFDSRPTNGTATGARPPFAEDQRFYDRDRDRDRDRFVDRDRDRDWDRDRDRHDPTRDRGRDRDIRDRRTDFFGRSYGRSHAPRPPPELRHYEPSYGGGYLPLARRYDPDDRRPGPRTASLERSKPPPFDDSRPLFDDRRPPPPTSADDRRLPLDDRPARPLPGASDTRTFPPNVEDRSRPAGDPMPLARATTEDDRGARATSLSADDRPRANVPLEERLSAPAPSLQDRLSQPAVAPARADISSAPSLEERLSLGPPRGYARSTSVVRDDLRPPISKEDPRDRERITDLRARRDFSRERPGGPLPTASSYRPDLERGFDRDDRDRRERGMAEMNAPQARFGDPFSRVGPPPQRRFSPPPPMSDRDRERRAFYPPRSPPPLRGEGTYDFGERRYTGDRERDAYERRRDWYPSDEDKRGAPPPAGSWRPHERPPPFMDRDRDIRDRDRERVRDLGGLPPPPPLPPTRGHWDERDRRFLPPSPPPSRMDIAGGRSLSARLTDPYPSSGGDDRGYPPPRDFDRGRYGAPPLDDHAHPPPFSRVRNRSPSPLRRGPGLADDMRPPLKRVRDDNGPGYGGAGSTYSPPRRGGGDYLPGPPPSSATTTTSVVNSVSGTVPSRSAGTRTPPASAPPPSSGTSGTFYEREREREREYVRGEYGMGYDRGRRSPPLLSSRMGNGPGYGRRDDRRYIPPPPPRPS